MRVYTLLVLCALLLCPGFSQDVEFTLGHNYWRDVPSERELYTFTATDTINEIYAKIVWKDQGWGNQKGHIFMKIKRDGSIIQTVSILGVAPHSKAKVEKEEIQCLFDSILPGDEIVLTANIGGGGGHKLTVYEFQYRLWYGPYYCPGTNPDDGTATIRVYCDNTLQEVTLSQDGGSSFQTIAVRDNTMWQTPVDVTVNPITDNTVLRVLCEDTGVAGGFISTLKYNGREYVTNKPLSDGNWEALNGGEMTVYKDKWGYSGYESSWGAVTGKDKTISGAAYWVWNSQANNEITFQFDFDNILNPAGCCSPNVAMTNAYDICATLLTETGCLRMTDKKTRNTLCRWTADCGSVGYCTDTTASELYEYDDEEYYYYNDDEYLEADKKGGGGKGGKGGKTGKTGGGPKPKPVSGCGALLNEKSCTANGCQWVQGYPSEALLLDNIYESCNATENYGDYNFIGQKEIALAAMSGWSYKLFGIDSHYADLVMMFGVLMVVVVFYGYFKHSSKSEKTNEFIPSGQTAYGSVNA